MDAKARARHLVLRVFKLLYLFSLVFFLAWSLRGYALTFWRYRGLWSGGQWSNPLSSSLSNPAAVLECRVVDSQLVVRLLRTYAEPEAEELQVVVELELVDGRGMKMEARGKVVLGGIVSLDFPLAFKAEKIASLKIEVYLDGKLVAARQGC